MLEIPDRPLDFADWGPDEIHEAFNQEPICVGDLTPSPMTLKLPNLSRLTWPG